MNREAYFYSLTAIVLWAILAFLSLQLTAMPALLLTGIVLLIGGLIGLRNWRQWRVNAATLFLGIFGLFGFHICYFLGLRNAPAVEVNLVVDLWPLMLILGSPLLFTEYRLSRIHYLAGLMGFTGVVLVVSGGQLRFDKSHLTGYAYSFLSAIIWTIYTLGLKRWGKYSSSAVGGFCVASGLLALVFHFMFEPAYLPSAGDWGIMILMGLGPMGGAFYLWDMGLKRGDPRIIGSLSFLIPLLSILILVATGRGQLGWHSAIAMALILGGVYLSANSGASATDSRPN